MAEQRKRQNPDSSSSSNRNKIVKCNECGKYMRDDTIKRHQCKRSTDQTIYRATRISALYVQYHNQIHNFVKCGRILDQFNFEVFSVDSSEIVNHFNYVHNQQHFAYKIRVSLGYLLHNQEEDEYAYYSSSYNNQLLISDTVLVRNDEDKQRFCDQLKNVDWTDVVNRPNTKWTLAQITNITFFVSKMTSSPIGAPLKLPDHLNNNKALISLTKSRKSGKPYSDNLCLFRCIALKKGTPVTTLEMTTKEVFAQYCQSLNIPSDVKDFPGVELFDINQFADVFEVGINVYKQDADGTTELIYRTIRRDNVMNVCLYSKHFSYISDLDKFSKSFRCDICDKLWTKYNNYKRHSKTCDVNVKFKYGCGAFRLKKTIFEELDDNGICVPQHLHYYPFYATYDIESILRKDVSIPNSKNVTYVAEHELVSVSVCSNVPGYKSPVCFVTEGDGQEVVRKMIKYLNEISVASLQILLDQYKPYTDVIEDDTLQQRFEAYLEELPVLSFNGGRYDLQVLRKYLIPELDMQNKIKCVLKRGSTYLCIYTAELKFLDIVYYLSPGYSYSSFLVAFGAGESKSFFCYEYLDSIEKLESKDLPPYDAFYSHLKSRNVLEENIAKGEDAREVGQVRYEALKKTFDENDWSLKDLLMHYNNADVKPFVVAVGNLLKYYVDRGQDIFKSAVSVPGVAERIAFNSLDKNDTFYLFNYKHRDLVNLFLSNNVGGPSIVFDRYQEKGKTKVKHDPSGKDCTKIVGFDANALYLWALGQEMPTSMFIRRREETGFLKEYPTINSNIAIEWLEHVSAVQGVDIAHARNSGEEVIAGYPVDGYSRQTKTVYQFMGCFWHGCKICFKINRDDSSKGRSMNDRYSTTQKRNEAIMEAGYNLVCKWGCAWVKERQGLRVTNPYLYPTESNRQMTVTGVLNAVLDGRLFGCLEVDIEVPENDKKKFAEFPPIFKNTTVELKDIGSHMQNFCVENGVTFDKRRCLISSMQGKRMLLITPLIIWYLEHGLQIPKVYQVIEFKGRRCFEKFMNTVTEDRREGDKDPTKSIIAETSKLVGNSVYGHSIQNKFKHKVTKFANYEATVRYVNDPFYDDLTEINEDYFEVEMRKSKIKFDLPIQIGFFVYSYAKLRMLQFYYDVLQEYLDNSSFSLLQMDTDSLYLAISGNTLDDLVKPDKAADWPMMKEKFFPREDTEDHKSYDKRTPGLFKLEWAGEGFVALAPKTYYGWNEDPNLKDKCSAKGINKSNSELTRSNYLSVLDTKQSKTFKNKGIIRKDLNMYNYEMIRIGLSYFYGKRKVLEDGISTEPLDI